MSTLLFLLFMVALRENPGFPYPDFTLQIYPETVMPGDTLYIKIVANNPHGESIYISDNLSPTHRDIQTCLRDSKNQEQPLLFESPMLFDGDRIIYYVEIKPGDLRIITALAVNVPPIEDLKEPFWEKHLKSLPAKNEKFLINVTVISYLSTNGHYRYNNEELPLMIETSLAMKPRPEKEMELIRKWYESQHPYFPGSEKYGKRGMYSFKSRLPKNTAIKNEKFSHWYFVRVGNRYPSESNVPETWQGWKELEESLTSSTMRDEIRLTRILIQYCDTEDDAVLKELKDWFDTMNEVQRTVMAKSLRDRAEGTYGNKELLPPFREIYKTIREYDVVPIPESNVKHLQNLGLIE